VKTKAVYFKGVRLECLNALENGLLYYQQCKGHSYTSHNIANNVVMQKVTWEAPLKTLPASQGLVAEMTLAQVMQAAVNNQFE